MGGCVDGCICTFAQVRQDVYQSILENTPAKVDDYKEPRNGFTLLIMAAGKSNKWMMQIRVAVF